MFARSVRLGLWNLPARGTALRLWDRLPVVGTARTAPSPQDPYLGCAGTFPVTREEGELFDGARQIGLRYELFRPDELDGQLPVILLSIPMGWGPGYPLPTFKSISEKLAGAGYLALSIWHTDSDRFILPDELGQVPSPKDYLGAAIRDPDTPHNRFLDVSFVIDTLEAWSSGDGHLSGHLSGHLDLDRIGMSGHSYGAHTAMALMGQKFGAERRSYRDARIKAGILYSLSPVVEPTVPAEIYADIDCPVFHMSGSRDTSWTEPSLPEDRLWPFHRIVASDQISAVLKGADHVTFSGLRDDDGTASQVEARNHQMIKSAALAFWDTHLKGDTGARRWLYDELPRILGRNGKVRRKQVLAAARTIT